MQVFYEFINLCMRMIKGKKYIQLQFLILVTEKSFKSTLMTKSERTNSPAVALL